MKESLHIRIEKDVSDLMPCKHAGETRNARRGLAWLCHGGIDEDDQGVSGFKGVCPGRSDRLIPVVSEFDIHQDAIFEGQIADKLQRTQIVHPFFDLDQLFGKERLPVLLAFPRIPRR